MAEDDVNVVFQVNSGGGLSATPTLGEYDPGNLVEIDRAIRHLPTVVAYLEKKANEMLGLVEKSEDFRVIVSTSGEQRARAYVAPANNGGIHLEAGDSVLLKAAVNMAGR
jgi:hypothetical protein